MRTLFAAPVAVLAVFAVLCAAPVFAAPPTDAAASVTAASPLPPLQFTDRVLPNGLRVLASENHQTPTVAIYVFYKVGSKDDPPGRSGFAHLFEHLMFKSTKNMASEQLDRLTEDVGGANNAYTADDATVYHETVPSNHLERLLWAEAERMSNLTVDAKNFQSERAVVQEEFRQSYAANPYGDLYLQTTIQGFAKHPYKRPGIGNLAELQSATLADVKAFHKTYYRPDNAVLVVVGDFDPAKLAGYVDKYFGAVAKPSGAVPRVSVVEPPRTEQRHIAVSAPDVPLPAFSATYLTPGVADADAPALDILASVLGDGESSRLFRTLVYDRGTASEVSVESNGNIEAGLFTVLITAASGAKLPDLETAAFAEMEKLRTEKIGAKELAKAKTGLIGGIVRARETADGTANYLGSAALFLGNPEAINTELTRINAVTEADVLRVAQKYLSPRNRVIISYTAKAAPAPVEKPSGKSDGKKVQP